MLLISNLLTYKGVGVLRVKGWKKVHHANINQEKRVGMITLMSDKVDAGIKKITRGKKGIKNKHSKINFNF